MERSGINRILFLLVCFAFLISLNSSASAATITSCETVTENSVLGADLTSSGTCLTVGTDNIVLDCAGYVITGDGNDYGIHEVGKLGVSIKNCNVVGFKYGIYIDSSANNSIINNYASDNTDVGINLRTSSNNNIINNTATNSEHGIYIGFSSNNNYLADNIVYSNFDGISIFRSDNNTVTNNDVSLNNDAGIILWEARNNILTDNIAYTNYWERAIVSKSTTSENTIINNTVITLADRVTALEENDDIIEELNTAVQILNATVQEQETKIEMLNATAQEQETKIGLIESTLNTLKDFLKKVYDALPEGWKNKIGPWPF